MADNYKKPFIRWQSRSLDYLSYAINLFLALSITSLGFGVNLLRDTAFNPSSCIRYVFGISLLALILGSAAGIACVLNRIKDFRDTVAIARKKSKEEYDEELEELRELVGVVGKTTRLLFKWQVCLFSIGVLLLVITILSVYSDALFQ